MGESDVAEIDHPVRRHRHALGEHHALEEFFKLGAGRDDRLCGH